MSRSCLSSATPLRPFSKLTRATSTAARSSPSGRPQPNDKAPTSNGGGFVASQDLWDSTHASTVSLVQPWLRPILASGLNRPSNTQSAPLPQWEWGALLSVFRRRRRVDRLGLLHDDQFSVGCVFPSVRPTPVREQDCAGLTLVWIGFECHAVEYLRRGCVNCATNGLRLNRFGRYTGWLTGMSPRPFRRAIGLPGWIHKPPTR